MKKIVTLGAVLVLLLMGLVLAMSVPADAATSPPTHREVVCHAEGNLKNPSWHAVPPAKASSHIENGQPTQHNANKAPDFLLEETYPVDDEGNALKWSDVKDTYDALCAKGPSEPDQTCEDNPTLPGCEPPVETCEENPNQPKCEQEPPVETCEENPQQEKCDLPEVECPAGDFNGDAPGCDPVKDCDDPSYTPIGDECNGPENPNPTDEPTENPEPTDKPEPTDNPRPTDKPDVEPKKDNPVKRTVVDKDCSDFAATDFVVTNDVHGLDADGDGVACEVGEQVLPNTGASDMIVPSLIGLALLGIGMMLVRRFS